MSDLPKMRTKWSPAPVKDSYGLVGTGTPGKAEGNDPGGRFTVVAVSSDDNVSPLISLPPYWNADVLTEKQEGGDGGGY